MLIFSGLFWFGCCAYLCCCVWFKFMMISACWVCRMFGVVCIAHCFSICVWLLCYVSLFTFVVCCYTLIVVCVWYEREFLLNWLLISFAVCYGCFVWLYMLLFVLLFCCVLCWFLIWCLGFPCGWLILGLFVVILMFLELFWVSLFDLVCWLLFVCVECCWFCWFGLCDLEFVDCYSYAVLLTWRCWGFWLIYHLLM